MTESTRGATADPRSMCIPAEWTDGALSEAEKPLTGEPDMEEVQFDIPEDAYGAGILAIVRDLQVIRAGPWSSEDVQVKVVQASFALLLLSMNLLMQLGLLYFINLFVVGPSVHKIQSQYLHFHERVFDSDGNFLKEEWEDYDGKEDLCQIGMSSPLFYFTVVFLWVLLIVRELRTTERLARDIWSMPSCRTSAAMTGEDSDHHVVQVVALTPCVRTLIYFMVILPKMVICCTLMYLGCQWLTATNSFADLVMNSIAMEFVTGVDEALYETLLPVAHRKQVADINFVTYRPRAGGRSKEFAAFKRSFIYLLLSTLLVIFYKWLGQTVLPENISDLKEACQDVNAQKRVSLCTSPFWRGSTGLDSCFPYGH